MRHRGSTRVVSGSILFFFLLFLGLAGGVQAAAPITAEYYGQLTVERSVLYGPGRVAVGPDGTFYVTDGYKNRVAVFEGNGAYKGTIPMLNASAVAVAADGTLYIGSNKDYSVSVVRNGQVAGHLGHGAGEFKSVTDLAVDAGSGKIYVADSVGNAVSIYNSAGTKVGSISDPNHPMGVSVSGREVYILNALNAQAPVMVYDTAGNFERSLGAADSGNCQMAQPTAIAVVNGTVYVSDIVRNGILVYDGNGDCLSEITDSKSEIAMPFSLALSANGILYVTSKKNHGVHAFTFNNDAGAGPGVSGK